MTLPMQQSKADSPLNSPNREADTALASACARHDPSAERRLIQQVFDLVVSTISYAVNSRTYADDIVQEALIEILDSMVHYRGDCSIETWTRKIALRVAMKTVKKQRRRAGLMFFFPRSEPEQPKAEEFTSNQQLRFHLNALVSKLPIKQQIAVRLRFVNELSIKEISQIVDAPEETVRHRIMTGRNRLKKIIERNPAFEGWLKKESGLK